MLNYTRGRAVEMLALAHKCVLATDGPAGVLASECRCEACDLVLYLLLPQTLDHLFNLEHNPRVALVTEEWELRGTAHVLLPEGEYPELALAHEPGAEWHSLVRVEPSQLHVRRPEGWGSTETIDLSLGEERRFELHARRRADGA